jgi:dihydroorotase-like cyclic amidohydrolase
VTHYDLVVCGGVVATDGGPREVDIAIAGGIIRDLAGPADAEIDATGLHILPGGVDVHVHFNEPGCESWGGCAPHIVHVSTGRGIAAVAAARARGVDVSAETCPHDLCAAPYRLESADLHYRHRHSPFVGTLYRASLRRTLVHGAPVAIDGRIVGRGEARLVMPSALVQAQS